MNEHVSPLLSAYYDGELSGRKLGNVEAHLETCAACSTELEALQNMNMLLGASPAAGDLLPPDIFVAQVGMRLPRKPEVSFWKKVSLTSWQAAPFGILGGWAVLQAILIVSSVVMLGLRTLPGIEQFGIELSGSGSLLGWTVVLNLGLTVLMGLCFWSWLASWWARDTNGISINS